MKKLKTVLLLYDQVLITILFLAGVGSGLGKNLGAILLLFPVVLYFSIASVNLIFSFNRKRLPHVISIGRILYVYSALITFLLFVSSLISIRSLPEMLLGLVFVPLPGHFFLNAYLKFAKWQRWVRRSKPKASVPMVEELVKPEALNESDPQIEPAESVEVRQIAESEETRGEISDFKRRQFIKLLGGGGLGMIVLLFLSPHKASAAFFGSGPGPGTVSLKDTAGTTIDPKEKTPTDGYTISQIDDTGSSNYFGFINKIGAWYISKEDNSGNVRYIKGTTNFSTNWTDRTNLTYDYFDNVF